MELITIASKPLGIKKVWFFEEKKVLSVKILSTHFEYVFVFYFYKDIRLDNCFYKIVFSNIIIVAENIINHSKLSFIIHHYHFIPCSRILFDFLISLAKAMKPSVSGFRNILVTGIGDFAGEGTGEGVRRRFLDTDTDTGFFFFLAFDLLLAGGSVGTDKGVRGNSSSCSGTGRASTESGTGCSSVGRGEGRTHFSIEPHNEEC